MSSREITEKVWPSIPGSELLFTLYGYWPTLHDAVIRNINIRFAAKEIEITVDYEDKPLGQDESVNSRVTLCWRNVSEAKLRLFDGDLYGIEFTEENGLIVTQFEQYPWGMDGFIHSAIIEVITVEAAPDMSAIPQDYTIHHEINIAMI